MKSPVRYSASDELKRLIAGENESVFQWLESRFSVSIQTRKSDCLLISPRENSDLEGVLFFLDQLKMFAKEGVEISVSRIEKLAEYSKDSQKDAPVFEMILRNRFGVPIYPKTLSQKKLVQALEKNDIVFANGPAGTGKTYLAVALAVAALERKEVERICLVRPAVEAGESLGFLPGEIKEKVAPYLRPIHDSLLEFLPTEKLKRYQESGVIEIAPLAYMRGRTLKRAFILLDEAQNATPLQMKMFLTRLGPHSKVIVTGDSTQVDLGRDTRSGFAEAIGLLQNIEGIAHIHFEREDVLRHNLVKDIIFAYEQAGKRL